MIARRSARQITLTLSDDSEVLLLARAAIGESLEWDRHRSFSTGRRQSIAPIACSLGLKLPKSNPAIRPGVSPAR
jgi:hypothetical protein